MRPEQMATAVRPTIDAGDVEEQRGRKRRGATAPGRPANPGVPPSLKPCSVPPRLGAGCREVSGVSGGVPRLCRCEHHEGVRQIWPCDSWGGRRGCTPSRQSCRGVSRCCHRLFPLRQGGASCPVVGRVWGSGVGRPVRGGDRCFFLVLLFRPPQPHRPGAAAGRTACPGTCALR